MTSTEVDGRFWLNIDGQSVAGSGRIQLLEQVALTGSISAAARTMQMSYKAAWDAIDAMNNRARQPLVLRRAGGPHGGGTSLTEYGRELIRQYRAAEAKHQAFLHRLSEHLPSPGKPEAE